MRTNSIVNNLQPNKSNTDSLMSLTSSACRHHKANTKDELKHRHTHTQYNSHHIIVVHRSNSPTSSVSRLAGAINWKYSTRWLRHELWTRMWIFDCDISQSANCGWTDIRSDTGKVKHLDAVYRQTHTLLQLVCSMPNNCYTWLYTCFNRASRTSYSFNASWVRFTVPPNTL